jgi:rhodanese-related sulfurtransferase
MYNQIFVKEFIDHLNKNKTLLVDVREKSEFDEGYIKGAINLPLSSLPVEFSKLDINEYNSVILYCKAGKRSVVGCEKLIAEGLISSKNNKNLLNLQGGIIAWEQEKYPLTTLKKK